MEKYIPDFEDAYSAFRGVYVHKMFHDNGRLPFYLPYEENVVGDFTEYEAAVYGLECVTEKVWGRYSGDEQVETLYFSDSAIMEYYRLCRAYGKRHGVRLADNPYMREAKRFVDRHLDQGCPVCAYHLHTGIGHAWASGIVFRMWPEFEWRYELLILMNKIRAFYLEQLGKLRSELECDDEKERMAA